MRGAGDRAEGVLALLCFGWEEGVLILFCAEGDPLAQRLWVDGAEGGRATKLTSARAADWRTVPLLTALAVGSTSTEADLWLVDGELLVRLSFGSRQERALTLLGAQVGHSRSSLTQNRTFASLYVGRDHSRRNCSGLD